MKPVFALILLPCFATAAPTSEPGVKLTLMKRHDKTKEGPVDIQTLNDQAIRLQGKLRRGCANFETNIGSPHPSCHFSATQKRGGTGKVNLVDDNALLWYGDIKVGTPPTTFTVDFDTGSSDLFLPSSTCDENCEGHTRYDTSRSSTAVDRNQTFSLMYGDGSTVSGEQYEDIVNIGGLTVRNQTVGAASTYSSGFAISAFPADGLMGMAFESISSYNAPPVFQTLMTEKEVAHPMFGFTLKDRDSELYLGGVDTSQVEGDITYAPVDVPAYWQVIMDGVYVGSKTVPTLVKNVIIDTGTTLVIGDPVTVQKIYDNIPGASLDIIQTLPSGFTMWYYDIPCDAVPDNVAIKIAGRKFPISAEALNLGPVSNGSTTCLGGIVGSSMIAVDTISPNSTSSGVNFWILGDVFLRNVYSVFDMGKARVGLAKLAAL